MKKIEAIIRQERLDAVKKALAMEEKVIDFYQYFNQ